MPDSQPLSDRSACEPVEGEMAALLDRMIRWRKSNRWLDGALASGTPERWRLALADLVDDAVDKGLLARASERDRLRAENERLRVERHRAINYLQCVRMCCGTVPGAEFDVERDELGGVMRAVGEFIDELTELARPSDEEGRSGA